MSSGSNALLEFIEAMKSQGASDEFVVTLLRQNGWSEKRIYQAFGTWYEARTGNAVPNGGGRIEAAKDAFLYLLAFITLGIWTIELGWLLFRVIDRTFPNAALGYNNNGWVTREVAGELAGMIVAFPLFLLVSRGIVRGLQQQPERLESGVRKWLTYITLVITASTMIGDVVMFLAYFLRGDLSTRFVLKVVTVLVIAGGVFAYYLDSLRRETVLPARNRLFASAAVGLVGLGVVLGFVQIGSPSAQRIASQDARRLFDLYSLAQGMRVSLASHAQSDFSLPRTIQDLQQSAPGETTIVDPVSGRTYGYFPLGGRTYRLCATFSRPSPADTPAQWRHSAGHVCFSRDAAEEVQVVQAEW